LTCLGDSLLPHAQPCSPDRSPGASRSDGVRARPYSRRFRAPLQPPKEDLRPCLAGAVLLLPPGSAHLWRAAAYVERNPSRARIVEHPGEYPWSSAPVHLGLTANAGFLDLSAGQAEYTPHRWTTVLAVEIDEEEFGRRLQEASRRGRPLGSDEFAQNLEKQTNRILLPLPAGRPRKRSHNEDGQLALEIGV
jgi:hypothetical protein